MQKLSFIFLLMLPGLVFSQSLTKETIAVSLIHLPPGMVDREKDPSTTGFVSEMLDAIEIAMGNEYELKQSYTTVKRVKLDLSLDKDIVFPAFNYSKKRQGSVYFSKSRPFLILPPGLFVKADDKRFGAFLNDDGEIDINEVLKDQSLKTIITADRDYDGYYHQNLTHQLRDLIGKSVSEMPAYSIVSAAKILKKKRIDYLIEYPMHFRHSLGKESEIYRFYPIASDHNDDELRFPLVGLAAPRSDWGKHVIQAINKVLYDPEVIKASSKAYKKFLPPESHAYYDRMNAEYQKHRPKMDKVLVDY